MNTQECLECGKERLAASLNAHGICRVCKPLLTDSSQSTGKDNRNKQIADSSTRAIKIVSIVNTVNAIAGIVLAIIAFAVGSDSENWGLVMVGFLILLAVAVGWAITRVFLGIAQDVKAIREEIKSAASDLKCQG